MLPQGFLSWNFRDTRITVFKNNSGKLLLILKINQASDESHTTWKVSKYGVFSGPYSIRTQENTNQKYEIRTLYLDTFHAV